jgi:cold shock CspA family protein
MIGIVKNTISDKGYGFILSEGKEYFFHSTECTTPFNSLIKDMKVKFEIRESPKGWRAFNVEKI